MSKKNSYWIQKERISVQKTFFFSLSLFFSLPPLSNEPVVAFPSPDCDQGPRQPCKKSWFYRDRNDKKSCKKSCPPWGKSKSPRLRACGPAIIFPITTTYGVENSSRIHITAYTRQEQFHRLLLLPELFRIYIMLRFFFKWEWESIVLSAGGPLQSWWHRTIALKYCVRELYCLGSCVSIVTVDFYQPIMVLWM